MASIKIHKYGDPLFKHISHEHLMYFYEILPEHEACCFACQSPCLGSPAYSCSLEDCEYHLHKRCFECPSIEVTHTSHREHPILLSVLDQEKIIECESCKRNTCMFVFKCSKSCNDWNLCIDCYLLPKYLDKYYFHSHDIDHDPNLTLSISPNCVEFTCSLCHMNFKSSTPRFGCTKCSFIIDVECALTPPIKHDQGQGHFLHFTHPYPMTLVNQKDEGRDDGVDKCCCSACDLPCTSGLAHFSCVGCKYFLHKSCAEFPIKIQSHPFVKGYLRFSFYPLKHKDFYCQFCLHLGKGFRFRSSGRISVVCGRCLFSTLIVKYEGHDHFLWFAEKVDDLRFIQCNAGYDNYCKLPVTSLELRSTESSMYRCFDCDYNIHLLCGPLPYSIECEYHIHPLLLVDLLKEDDSEEPYCDICEDKRNPSIRVYHCHKCKYVAHVHCLYSQIVTILRRDPVNLRLRTPKINEMQKIGCNPPKETGDSYNFKEYIWETLNGDEKLMLQCDFDTEKIGCNPPMDMVDTLRIQKLTRFSADYFEKLIDGLNNVEINDLIEWKKEKIHSLLGSNFVSVDGYKVPASLAKYLVGLFRKYGDISSNSKSTQGMKSIAFCFLCQFLSKMHEPIYAITLDRLKEWYFDVNYAERRGFDVEFMFDYLKDVARAFIGLQATAERNGFSIWHVGSGHVRELQNELNLIKSGRSNVHGTAGGFVNWGEFLMECLSMVLMFRNGAAGFLYPLIILN